MFLPTELHSGKKEQNALGRLKNVSHTFKIIYERSSFIYKAKYIPSYHPKFCNYYYKLSFIEQVP